MKPLPLLSPTQARSLVNKAQMLTEVLVGLAIFIFGFTVFFMLINSYLISFRQIRERLVANFLAQEGLELVLAKRNENIAKNIAPNPTNWLDGLASTTATSTTIYLDYNLATSSSPQLFIDDSGFFSHRGATPTSFSRAIILNSQQPLNQATSVEVISRVNFYDQQVEFKTIITKWHPDIP